MQPEFNDLTAAGPVGESIQCWKHAGVVWIRRTERKNVTRTHSHNRRKSGNCQKKEKESEDKGQKNDGGGGVMPLSRGRKGGKKEGRKEGRKDATTRARAGRGPRDKTRLKEEKEATAKNPSENG